MKANFGHLVGNIWTILTMHMLQMCSIVSNIYGAFATGGPLVAIR